jgi:hypothetical protein
MGITNLILLALTLVLQGALLLVLVRRHVFWQFPFFFAYSVYSLVATVVLLAVNSNYRLYFYLFWVNEACLALLAVLALHEVFRRVFFGFYSKFREFRLLFPTVIAFVVVFVLWTTEQSPPIRVSPLRSAILLFGIAVNMIQIGLFSLFLAVGRTFLLRWRFAPLGIILGFTATALGSVLDYWVISEFGTRLEAVTKYVPPVAYILTVIVWLDTFLRPESGPVSVSAATLRQVAEAIRQDTARMKSVSEKNQ